MDETADTRYVFTFQVGEEETNFDRRIGMLGIVLTVLAVFIAIIIAFHNSSSRQRSDASFCIYFDPIKKSQPSPHSHGKPK